MTEPAPPAAAPPSRRRETRRAPLAVVIVVCLVPAVGLAGLWRWADGSASEAPPTTTTTVPAGPPAPTLRTDLASLRRVPAPLAERVAEDLLTDHVVAGLEPVRSAATGDTNACAAVTLGGEPIAAVDADVPVVPASNQKLLVGAVALDVIGADTTFVTEVRGAPIVDGVVAGDLFLVGGGDPLLQASDVVDDLTFPAFDTTSFDDLADQLVAAGLVRVEGDVVGDGTRYDDEFVVPAWGDDITRRDGGPIGALLVSDGRILGAGYGLNPAQSAASELNRLLSARGVTITGGNRAASEPTDGAEQLAVVESVPLQRVVTEMLYTSDNNTAEMLLKEIGYVGAGDGSRPAGMAIVRERLAGWDVPLTGASLEDGSGLARVNAVPCATFVALLAHVGSDGELADALPVAARTGALENQLVDTAADGVVAAKTGTLTGVKAISGFFPTDDGTFEFTILLEGDGVDVADVHLPIWLALFDALADLPEAPSVDDFGPR